jgi:hypothetical protein
MKKILMLLFMAVATLGANAQFDKGTHYVGAGLSGLGIGWEKGSFNFGIGAEYGYFVADSWMIGGAVNYAHKGGSNSVQVKPYFRYSFKANGLNLGCGLQYEHVGFSQNYIQLSPQVGYTFYLNDKVSIEPALYADFGMNDFRNGTNAGLKIAFGLYK